MKDGKALLEASEDFLLNGDYGSALFYAKGSRAVALASKDVELEIRAFQLSRMIKGLMIAHVVAEARNSGIPVTKKNVVQLYFERSPHEGRYRELLKGDQSDYSRAPILAEDISKIDELGVKRPQQRMLDRIIIGEPTLEDLTAGFEINHPAIGIFPSDIYDFKLKPHTPKNSGIGGLEGNDATSHKLSQDPPNYPIIKYNIFDLNNRIKLI